MRFYFNRLLKFLSASKPVRTKEFPNYSFLAELKTKNNINLFQVFGTPRSGTTLLASILDHLEGTICLIEPQLSLYMEGKIRVDAKYRIPPLKKHSLKKTLQFLGAREALKNLGFKETYRSEFHPTLPTRSLLESNICSPVFDYHIVIIRDPRDSWASVVKRHPVFEKDKEALDEYLYSWKSLCNLISYRNDILVIRYEDLIINTQQVLQRLYQYLSIPPTENLFPLNAIEGFGDKTAQGGGHISQSTIKRYYSYLPADKIKYIEDECCIFLSSFDY